jgi:Holliday junction DNA helicase RuvA
VEPIARRAPQPISPAQSRASASADALSALVNLGYGQGDAAMAVATVVSDQPEATTANLIRACLKLLAPKG